jgi:Cd(II)/Pb(II)-responsive transcriptional regulator
MRIGQLAKLVGIDTQTIRFYEQKGLLPKPHRQENGYRAYTKKHRDQLVFIRSCRALNLSLAEIQKLQNYQNSPNQPCAEINTLLEEHISQVRLQISSLQTLEKQLVSLRATCNDNRKIQACGVLAGIREVNIQG